ncbi:hypothetical protein ACFWD7_18660 [Streptomyces mirabilis]|uniref:AMP-binding enzyme n=1 Tax=Streptomyces mirabilis TaxID=68239 RepID=UPI00368A56EC
MYLGWQAKQRPDAIAVIESGGRTVTNAELDARSRQLAAPLDLRPGLIERHRGMHAQFVPTMFVRMLKLPAARRARDLSSLLVVLHGVAPCPVGRAGDDVRIVDGVVHFGENTLGDIGHLDEDGHLYLTDRAGAADVAVIGVPDPERGERVLAVVQPAAADVTADELLAYCRKRLAPYSAVDFVLSLPRDPSGTLRKGLLRETYWRNHETRIV